MVSRRVRRAGIGLGGALCWLARLLGGHCLRPLDPHRPLRCLHHHKPSVLRQAGGDPAGPSTWTAMRAVPRKSSGKWSGKRFFFASQLLGSKPNPLRSKIGTRLAPVSLRSVSCPDRLLGTAATPSACDASAGSSTANQLVQREAFCNSYAGVGRRTSEGIADRGRQLRDFRC
jgi:hypothetical protein